MMEVEVVVVAREGGGATGEVIVVVVAVVVVVVRGARAGCMLWQDKQTVPSSTS